MTKPPEKWKLTEDLTAADHAELMARRARGEFDPKVERQEYRDYRNAALEAAGLEPDQPAEEVPVEERTAEDFARAMQRPPK
jgi:hypothetical protein